MSKIKKKKKKKSKRPKGWLIDPKQIDNWLIKAAHQMQDENHKGVIRTCKQILRYLPKQDKVRAETLGLIGASYGMQKKFEDAYQTFSEAVQIDKEDAYLWFNHGLSCRYTSRAGQSLRSIEKAVQLEGDGEMATKFTEDLAFARKLAEGEIALRGEGFTLEELIEQQKLFQQGIQLLEEEKWEETEKCFRKSIAMGDCLPQPWGNLGIALSAQNRFDEAEDAYNRALEIDPNYQNAKTLLATLEYRRAHPDIKPEYKTSSPFDDIKPSIIINEV